MGAQNGHTLPFLKSASLKKKEEEGNDNGKKRKIKYLKGNSNMYWEKKKKKKRLKETGKNRRWERVPKVESRKEETIT